MAQCEYGGGVTEDGEKFVNPYTFVPFPQTPPVRSAPTEHIADPDLLCGKLAVTITVKTSVLIHGFGTAKAPDVPRDSDGQVIIPGSSWKGAIRSLHETITGSCLRIFDGDFVPGYRDPALESTTRNLRMAIVDEPGTDEAAPTVRLCPDPSDGQPWKVAHTLLLDAAARCGALVKSGERIHLDIDENTTRVRSITLADDGEWVVAITDASTRNATSRNKRAYKAQVRPYPTDASPIPIPEHTWKRFLHAVDGARDLTTSELQNRSPGDIYTPVVFQDPDLGERKIGQRHYASRTLLRGQPVWVRLDADGEIDSLRLAMVWRHSGALTDTDGEGRRHGGSAKERVDPGFHPCTDWSPLCPSCQVFGSADTSGTETPDARQNSYRGHVRFSDAVAEGEVSLNKVFTRAPMSSPRPGSGQFYLVNDERTEGNVGDPPLREWGSDADKHTGRPRGLRGRKYYWHTPAEAPQPRRAKVRDHPSNELARYVITIPKNTRLTATVVFDNLTEFQLGGLVAALQPSALLPAPEGNEIWQHIGGGKPLGLGGCRVHVDEAESRIEKVGARYGRQAEPVPARIDRLIRPFQDRMHAEHAAIASTWTALTKALASAAVPADHVWYPPKAGWKPASTLADEAEPGFNFWKQHSGTRLAESGTRRGYPLRSLPHVEADDQTMRVVGKAAEKPVRKNKLSPEDQS